MRRHSDSHATSYRDGGHWREDAACRDEDPELFFPHDTDHLGIAAAKRICDGCPVVVYCLLDALNTEQRAAYGRFGVRGGLTGDERTRQFGKPKTRRQGVGR